VTCLAGTRGVSLEWLAGVGSCDAGKDPTKKVVKRAGRRGVTQRKTIQQDSFFNFFSPPQIPDAFNDMDGHLAEVRCLCLPTRLMRARDRLGAHSWLPHPMRLLLSDRAQ
jgi:Nucleosome assembly protein (NAP)